MGAGEGTRMWPISTMVNKHLLKLGGKPVIRHIVDRLIATEYFDVNTHDSSITIVCLKKDEKDYEWEFRDYMRDKQSNILIRLHVLEENSATATEFYDALKKLPKIYDNTVLLHYGDTITDLNYRHFIEFYWTSPGRAMIAVTQNIRHDYSKVDMEDNKLSFTRVKNMVEKPELDFPSWTGIALFQRDFIEGFLFKYAFPVPTDFGYGILPKLTELQELYAYKYNGQWFDVGNLRSYQKLAKEYQNKDLNL